MRISRLTLRKSMSCTFSQASKARPVRCVQRQLSPRHQSFPTFVARNPPKGDAAVLRIMRDHWTEKLVCPNCRKAGVAELLQIRTTFLGTYELTAFPRALTFFNHSTGSNFTAPLATSQWGHKARLEIRIGPAERRPGRQVARRSHRQPPMLAMSTQAIRKGRHSRFECHEA